jgi:hypothetical protein
MTTLLRFLVIACVGLLVAGCTSFARVIPESIAGMPPCATPVAVYSRSYFQARYQGKFIASMILGGPVLAVAAMSQSQDVDRSKQRLASGPFEQLLGDFDVLAHVTQHTRTAIGQARLFTIQLADDPAAVSTIISHAQAAEASKTASAPSPTGGARRCIGAFKVAYGLGARAGAEQFGFRKSYRPFVQIVGAIYDADTKRAWWRDAVIAFGPIRYLGSDADADQIESKELVQGLQTAARDAVEILVKSLNSDAIAERAILVDGNDADLAL